MIYNVIGRKKKTTPISDVDVGSSVYCKVDGVRTEFLIVQKGNPDTSIYDSSCDGIWLLAKDCLAVMKFEYQYSYVPFWRDERGTYLNPVYVWMNGDFYNSIDIKSIIKSIKIPYITGKYDSMLSQLPCTCFLLGAWELGLWIAVNNARTKNGSLLQYFKTWTTEGNIGYQEQKQLRIANYGNETNVGWFTRDDYVGTNDNVNGVIDVYPLNTDDYRIIERTASYVRPCFIIPSDTKIDASGNILV